MDSQGLTDSVNMSNVSWRLLLTSGYQARADHPEERCLCMLSHGYSSILKEIFSKPEKPILSNASTVATGRKSQPG